MAKKLTDQNTKNIQGSRLVKTEAKFKLSIEHALHNNFCFKKLNRSSLLQLDNFIDETVDKGLTISQVDNLFLRKRGPKEQKTIKGSTQEIMHYGKDRNPFRIFGYYSNGYFVLTKIDPNHETHKA
ncbi:hypothetical protein SDC9_137081 [bioreactor metagenome]|uniref:Uncharacterized protein n=1 Tax=bioreactor metagenome TaxID=1076179 RepID=A0A645DKX5_9ZZZZ